jgi:hypothetical protein
MERASTLRANQMNEIADTAQHRDVRLENFAAELTSAIYPIVLRRGGKESWLHMELSLWRALAETVQKWARRRPPAASSDEFEAWRDGLLVDLTESAFFIAVRNGIKGSLLDLELRLYRAVRLVTRRYSRVRQSE